MQSTAQVAPLRTLGSPESRPLPRFRLFSDFCFGTRELGASRACTLRSKLSRPNVSVIQKKSGSSASGASILEHRWNQVVCCRLSCRLLLTVGPGFHTQLHQRPVCKLS